MTHRPDGKQQAADDRYCILGFSMHLHERDWLDAAIERLRAAGLYRMNRSRLVRIALERLDLDAVLREEAGRTTNCGYKENGMKK